MSKQARKDILPFWFGSNYVLYKKIMGEERGREGEGTTGQRENRKKNCVCIVGWVGLGEVYFFDVMLGFETEAVPGSCYCDGD